MRNNTLIFLALLLGSGCLFGQNSNLEFNRAFKVSNLSTFRSGQIRYGSGTTSKWNSVDLLKIVPSYMWKGKGAFFNEISLHSANFAVSSTKDVLDANGLTVTPNARYRSFSSNLAVKYSKFYSFFSQSEHKLVPMIGMEVMPYFSAYNRRPVPENLNIFQYRELGLKTFVTPRLTYFATKRLFFDASVQLPLLDMSYKSVKNLNAAQNEIHHTKGFGIGGFLEGISTQVGVGLKF